MSAIAILAILIAIAGLDYSVRKERSFVALLDKDLQTKSQSYREFRSRQ
jgi:hypothetical protein